jgi:cytochrome P450
MNSISTTAANPVARGPLWRALVERPAVEATPSGRIVHVGAMDVCRVGLRDAASLVSSAGIRLGSDEVAVRAAANRTLIVSDPPVHASLRSQVLRGLTVEQVGRAAPSVSSACDAVCDAVAAGDTGLLAAALATLPVVAVSALLGVSGEVSELARLTATAIGTADTIAGAEANAELFALILDWVEGRRAGSPLDVMVSGLNLEQAILNVHGLLVAAVETTRHAATLALWCLAQEGAGLAVLRMTIQGSERFVEEVLRWGTPGMHVMRTAARATVLESVELLAGDRAVFWLAAANRDHRVHARPDKFDWTRTDLRHIAFGYGPHACVGAHLARLELRLLVDSVVRRFDVLHLLNEPKWSRSNFLNEIRGLHIQGERIA